MKYFETKHEKDSAKITALITIILVLLLFIVGHDYMDPPEEYGIAVNFGTTDFGSGRIQPKEPIKSTPQEIKDTPKETTKEVRPKENVKKESPEEALTEDNEESIAMKKKKAKEDAERKAKEAAERAERERKEAEERKQREEEEKRKKLDEMMGGLNKSDGEASGSEGNDDSPGDKGQIDGNPYANSYYGQPGSGEGGLGYGLKGRGKATYKRMKQDCNEEGLVIVRIVVNREGRVIETTPGVKGTTNNHPCLLEPAKKIALSHKWRPDPKAPSKQIGFVKVNFNLGQ
ncbi:MAG: energy transducer TonB [Flavobacteriaceae bacterium]|nr:MAG: energy transducer TonB [Flavobacteriaceae bacterium]